MANDEGRPQSGRAARVHATGRSVAGGLHRSGADEAPDARPGSARRPVALVALFTVLGALFPGLGLLVAGWRKTGALILGGVVVAAAVIGVRVGRDPLAAAASLVGSRALMTVTVVVPVVALAWAAVVVASHRALRSASTSRAQRGVMSALVGVLCLAVLTPAALASQLAATTRHTVNRIFTATPQPSGAPAIATGRGADPWATTPRLNVLVLGSDAGPSTGGGIREGVRTDSIVVASIDTHTGNTVLISVARNLQRLQFPPGSALAAAYPGGYATYPNVTSGTGNGENLVNSIYRDVPAQHPGTDGAAALMSGLSQSLGLPISYYVLVSLTGFKQVIDALGGVTVNINRPTAVGGSHDPTVYPYRFLMPGPAKHLTGYEAEWFARGRFNTTDNVRLRQQQCTVNALTTQATPAKLLLGYQSLADTAANVTLTNIHSWLLPTLVRLGDLVKTSGTQSSLVVDQYGIPGLDQFDPDWNRVRAAVQLAIHRSQARSAASTATRATPGTTRATSPPTSTTRSTATASGTPQIQADLVQTCAYDAKAAAANIAEWRTEFGSRYADNGQPR